MKRKLTFAAILISILAVLSCTGRQGLQSAGSAVSSCDLDSLREVWRSYNVAGEYDSLIAGTLPYYRKACEAGDTLPLLYTGTFIAQAYLFKENVDSVNYYLSYISPYEKACSDPAIKAIYNIVYGCYLLKVELDYSKALSAFYEGLEFAEQSGDVNNQIVLLANISNIFYTRSDRHGIEYAQKAWRLADRDGVADFPRCQAYLVMAQMLQLSEEYPQMLVLLDKTGDIVDSCGFMSLIPYTSIIYASYYREVESFRLADSSFRRAIRYSGLAEPSMASYIYMQYGDFCRETGKAANAAEAYLSGLEISYRNNNAEFRSELLQRLSDISSESGDKAKAVYYADALRRFRDSLATYRKELDFNNLLLSYQRMEHEHEIQKKELDLLRANKKILVSGSLVLLVLVVSGFLLLLYFRQRRMYRTLVLQHRNYMQRLQSGEAGDSEPVMEDPVRREQPEKPAGSDAYEKDIYLRIEELMKSSRIYRQKDLSLDRLAEMLGTNRTYVSRAINMFSGLTFYAYLDLYRIREATELISKSGEEIPFKQMADDLGYNSVSVFYKAFRKETGCTPGRYRDEIRRIDS